MKHKFFNDKKCLSSRKSQAGTETWNLSRKRIISRFSTVTSRPLKRPQAHPKIIFLRFPIDFVQSSSESETKKSSASFGLSLVGGQIALSEK